MREGWLGWGRWAPGNGLSDRPGGGLSPSRGPEPPGSAVPVNTLLPGSLEPWVPTPSIGALCPCPLMWGPKEHVCPSWASRRTDSKMDGKTSIHFLEATRFRVLVQGRLGRGLKIRSQN